MVISHGITTLSPRACSAICAIREHGAIREHSSDRSDQYQDRLYSSYRTELGRKQEASAEAAEAAAAAAVVAVAAVALAPAVESMESMDSTDHSDLYVNRRR